MDGYCSPCSVALRQWCEHFWLGTGYCVSLWDFIRCYSATELQPLVNLSKTNILSNQLTNCHQLLNEMCLKMWVFFRQSDCYSPYYSALYEPNDGDWWLNVFFLVVKLVHGLQRKGNLRVCKTLYLWENPDKESK